MVEAVDDGERERERERERGEMKENQQKCQMKLNVTTMAYVCHHKNKQKREIFAIQIFIESSFNYYLI